MKKRLAVTLGLVLMVSALAGCKSNLPADRKPTGSAANTESSAAPEASSQAQSPEESEDAGRGKTEGGVLKTGLGIITTVNKSTDAGEEDGLAQADAMVAAVTVDAEGKITNCVIDSVQAKINFSKEGKLTTDISTAVATKNELGTDYGMGVASGIGKEWNEQAAFFADYVTGKTLDEVKGITVTEEGLAGDADLAAGITVHIGDFISIVEKAVGNASELGAAAGDKLGLGVVTTLANSTDASAEGNGAAEAYSTYTAVTFGADGKVTSCIIDAAQAQVGFDTTGKITSDIQAEVSTKDDLGDAYGMKAASSIGKEWNEQAAAYASYVKGKTIDEIKGIAVKEGVPSDADLAAGVTIHITDFNAVIEKAAASAE